ncbi:hypothetical protein MLD38_017676 [Melastoma candidum]|uniref:Uncharacterized protein n=1 Tax=Melastoma candidum TaxID=119954 RepID=A0ACB9QZM8_9MYRT|nr:hypothetical protein MLD38_017676 [Melastoma candidum]
MTVDSSSDNAHNHRHSQPPPYSFSTDRDWFFPSPSYIHNSPLRPINPRRRLSTPPPPSFQPKPPPPFPSSRSSANSFSSPPPYRDDRFHYAPPASVRRRPLGYRCYDASKGKKKSELPDIVEGGVKSAAAEDVSAVGEKGGGCGKRGGYFVRDVGVSRLQLVCSVAILLTAFSALVNRNFALHAEVLDLQGKVSELEIRLQDCNLWDSSDGITVIPEVGDDGDNKRLKNISLMSSIAVLLIPTLFFKCIDRFSKLRSSDNVSEEVSLNKQLAYRVDVLFSVHPYAKPLALLIATLLLICLGGLALYGVTEECFADCLWLSWTYVASAGNHADSEGLGPRLVSLSISFGGMLIFAMMLGLVSDAISEKFDSLRKGKSEVVEQNHTLILGWSDKLGSLLNQLALANESLGGGTIVVMAEHDKEEMELDIAKMEFDFRGTSVICRSGSPLILADLKKVSVSKARAVIVLAEDGNADQSDARALRTVLSLTGVKEGLRGHIVVELSDLDNEVLVKLVGGDLVETVVAHDVIGRLMIQCARQPGLAQIWEDILGFENCEFYIKKWPQLVDMQFEDVLLAFPDAIPCGIKVASRGGKIILNPDDSYVLQEGDEVLVIAEDDDTYAPAELPTVNDSSFMHVPLPVREPQKILLCGWRRDVDDMIVVSSFFKA